MKWKDIAQTIGTIAGIISLVGVVYSIGYKMGVIDDKVSTLWDFYIESRLKISTSAGHQSLVGNPVANNPSPQVQIPKNLLSVINRITNKNIHKKVPPIVSLIIQELYGNQRNQVNTFKKDNNLTTDEFINLIADEVRRIKGG